MKVASDFLPLPSMWAGDVLAPCRPVYRLDCVDTHGVHVSSTDIFPPVFGRPFSLLPAISVISTLFTLSSSFLLITCPYHFNCFSVIFLDACVTLVVSLI